MKVSHKIGAQGTVQQQPRCARPQPLPSPSFFRLFPKEYVDSNAFSTLVQNAGRSLVTAAAALSLMLSAPLPADALLNSPAARLPRTPDAALRRSIPAFNQDVKSIQAELEAIQFKLRIPQRKPWAAMGKDLAGAVEVASSDDRMLRGILPQDRETALDIISNVRSDLNRLAAALALKDTDRTSIRVANTLERLSALELLQAPGLPYPLPAQYKNLARLTGRAVVELDIEKANGRAAFVQADSEDGAQSRVVLRLTLDGYSAPITAGNFALNVLSGQYDGQTLVVGRDSIQAGGQGKDIGALPLEIMPNGDLEPVYRLPLDVRSGEIPVLPLSIYGAAAMTHLPGADASVGFVSSRQFFIYKYERQSSGLAGLAFDEGAFGVFGYITQGTDQLQRIDDGDRLVSARLVEGKDKLVVPEAPKELAIATEESTAQ